MDLIIKPIPAHIAREIIIRNHYTKRCPDNSKLTLGVFVDGQLMGAVTFGPGACPNYKALVEGSGPRDYLELTRLWIDDRVGKNAESRAVAACLRLIRKYAPTVRWIISFADANAGHVGTIYQAANFLYTGTGSQGGAIFFKGRKVHRRTVGKAYKSSRMEYLRQFDPSARIEEQLPKHRYVYFLDPEWRPRLKLPVLPYPKSASSSTAERPAHQPGGGGPNPTLAHHDHRPGRVVKTVKVGGVASE